MPPQQQQDQVTTLTKQGVILQQLYLAGMRLKFPPHILYIISHAPSLNEQQRLDLTEWAHDPHNYNPTQEHSNAK
jgi:hypothetical protein